MTTTFTQEALQAYAQEQPASSYTNQFDIGEVQTNPWIESDSVTGSTASGSIDVSQQQFDDAADPAKLCRTEIYSLATDTLKATCDLTDPILNASRGRVEIFKSHTLSSLALTSDWVTESTQMAGKIKGSDIVQDGRVTRIGSRLQDLEARLIAVAGIFTMIEAEVATIEAVDWNALEAKIISAEVTYEQQQSEIKAQKEALATFSAQLLTGDVETKINGIVSSGYNTQVTTLSGTVTSNGALITALADEDQYGILKFDNDNDVLEEDYYYTNAKNHFWQPSNNSNANGVDIMLEWCTKGMRSVEGFYKITAPYNQQINEFAVVRARAKKGNAITDESWQNPSTGTVSNNQRSDAFVVYTKYTHINLVTNPETYAFDYHGNSRCIDCYSAPFTVMAGYKIYKTKDDQALTYVTPSGGNQPTC